MKTYRALAYKELLASKITSVLILIAVILSTMMTTAIGQSLGILSAMRDQQAIALNGNRYATFVQMDQAQVDKIRADPRISYAGVSVSVGTVELNRILTLGLNEYWGDSLSAYPSLSQVEEGRLPERPMEIALPEDVLQMLGFSGDVGDTISLAVSKALRHGVQTTDFSYTGQFTLTGILRSNYLGYSAGVVQGIVGKGTAEDLLPPDYLYYNVDIRTKEKAAFQETAASRREKRPSRIPRLNWLMLPWDWNCSAAYSPANPIAAAPDNAASNGEATARKAATTAPCIHPVPVTRAIRGSPFSTPKAQIPSVMRSVFPDRSTTV